MDGPKIIGEFISKATFATDVYSVTMTSFVFIFHIQFVGTIIFLKEKFMAGCPFGDQVFIAQVISEENTCQIDQKMEDGLWSLWGEGWNQDTAMCPNMENYVGRLTHMV